MQIWIYFVGGYGGDGLINLLERSPGVTPLDDTQLYLHDGTPNWRPHRYVDNVPKFWAPSIYAKDTYRSQHGCDDDNWFTDAYLNAVANDLTIVTGCHDTCLSDFANGRGHEIYSKNRISVLIVPNLDIIQDTYIRLKKAHLLNVNVTASANRDYEKFKQDVEQTVANQNLFDLKITNIRDNQQLIGLHKELGLACSDEKLEQWHQILNGKSYLNIPHYKSIIKDDSYHYVSVQN